MNIYNEYKNNDLETSPLGRISIQNIAGVPYVDQTVQVQSSDNDDEEARTDGQRNEIIDNIETTLRWMSNHINDLKLHPNGEKQLNNIDKM